MLYFLQIQADNVMTKHANSFREDKYIVHLLLIVLY